MMCHYSDLGSASDNHWSCHMGNLIQPISMDQIFVLISQMSFGGETSGNVANCRLFSQAGLGWVLMTLSLKKS